jgi:hypothetical protein
LKNSQDNIHITRRTSLFMLPQTGGEQPGRHNTPRIVAWFLHATLTPALCGETGCTCTCAYPQRRLIDWVSE